jgi:hypothetical protein
MNSVQWLLTPAISSPATIWTGHVSLPGFPIVPRDLLVTGNAVFAGVEEDQYGDELTKWNILYADTLPTTVFVDSSNVVRGWEFWYPNERTYVITRLFNIVTGTIPKDVFAFPDPSDA